MLARSCQGRSLSRSGTATPTTVRSDSARSSLLLRCTPSSTPGPDLSSLAGSIGTSWDPEGLFPPMENSSSEHFVRKMQSPAAPASSTPQGVLEPTAPQDPSPSAVTATPLGSATPQLPSSPGPTPPSTSGPYPQDEVELISPQALEQGGLSPADLSAEKRAELEFRLMSEYMTVDLNMAGLKILCMDPPIFTVDNFFPDASCDNLVAAAQESGCMVLSMIGGGNISSGGVSNQYNERRNSSGMLLDNNVLAVHTRLQRVVTDFQSRCKGLLQAKKWRAWGKPGSMPNAGQYTYESAQITQYETGQHFMSHEDAFPRALAQSNGFQRSATLLLYLNTVPQGGCTRFEKLNLAVAPSKGKMLIFFPSKADGTADSRTLHSGEDAEATTKHVIQQWVVCGWGALPAAAAKARSGTSPAPAAASSTGGGATSATSAAAAAAAAGGTTPQSFSISVPIKAAAAAGAEGKKSKKGGSKKKTGFGKK